MEYGVSNIFVCVCVCVHGYSELDQGPKAVCSEDGKQRSGSVNGGILVLFRLADW